MKFACYAAARRRDGSVKQDSFSLQKYLNSLQTIMQPAILHIIYFTIPASIIPLTLLHTKLEPVTGPADVEGMKYTSKKGKKRYSHVKGFGTSISAASLHVLYKVFLSPSLLNTVNFYPNMV